MTWTDRAPVRYVDVTDGPLPEQTRDDTDAGWGEPENREDADDQRFLDERPPHHDR